ncbi:MAG: restriction endonuclease subunit R, partial [Desulfamplus sp.]|nr:restriction endonuclease subunit R [Desulfamplus sp.]
AKAKKMPQLKTFFRKLKYFYNHPVVLDKYPKIQSITSSNTKEFLKKDDVKLESRHLSLLNFDELYFELERFKRERSWYNLNISKHGIYKLLSDKTWYTLFLPTAFLNPSDFDAILMLQHTALELIKNFCEKYYNLNKRKFLEPRLEIRELTSDDDNIPLNNSCYQLFVDSNEKQLISDIRKIKTELEQNKNHLIKAGDIKACRFGIHLFNPLLHLCKGSKITITPVALNESEFQFVTDLKQWIDNNISLIEKENMELFLLRNFSRGKGVGFFEAGNFHPDFILWMLIGKKQYITFLEPHGLIYEGIAGEKILFHERIKIIENRLSDKNVVLNSFILSWTAYKQLFKWGISKEELEENHILFMTDDRDGYIEKLFTKLKTDTLRALAT